MNTDQKSKRYELLDIMKGLLIILVVLGHTNNPFTKWIYSFHMAAFFAISGFLWNNKNVEDRDHIVCFLKRRILRLYFPFVVVNIVFILLNNIFIKVGLYTTSAEFAVLTEKWPVKQVGSFYSVSQIFKNCIKSFLLISGHAPIVGVSWYLATIFIVSLIHLIVEIACKKIEEKKRIILYVCILVVCLIISCFGTLIGESIPGGWIIKRICPAYSAFLMGYFLKQYLPILIRRQKTTSIFCILSAAVGITVVILDPRIIELSKGFIINPIYFILGSIQGIVVIYLLSKIIIQTRLSNAFKYIGQKSMSIMLLHVLSFKLVNLLAIYINKFDFVYLAARRVIYDLPVAWSIVYLLIGVSIPVLFDMVVDKVKIQISNDH